MLKRMIIPFLSILILACGSPETISVKDSTIKKTDPVTNRLSEKEKAYYNNKIELLYNTSLKRTGFNGSILLAKKGEIVFEDYRGLINFRTKEAITANSEFHLASVSKTFTATVILHLMEQGKINLEDAVEK